MYPSRPFPRFPCPLSLQGWPFAQLLARVPASAVRQAGYREKNAYFFRHKIPKRSHPALSKPGVRWYIPLAPRGLGPGCLLRKPPDRIDRRLRAWANFVSVPVFAEGVQRFIAGWSSPVARQAHNLKVTGSNPVPATKTTAPSSHRLGGVLFFGTCLIGSGNQRPFRPWRVMRRSPSPWTATAISLGGEGINSLNSCRLFPIAGYGSPVARQPHSLGGVVQIQTPANNFIARNSGDRSSADICRRLLGRQSVGFADVNAMLCFRDDVVGYRDTLTGGRLRPDRLEAWLARNPN